MRVYCVVTEHDGETTIEREEYRYAAENIEEVWIHVEWLRKDPEEEVIAIYAEHPTINIIEA